MINHKISKKKTQVNYFCFISESIIEDLINNNYLPFVINNYINFKKNNNYNFDLNGKKNILNVIYNNITYYPFLKNNNIINLYFCKLNKNNIFYLFKKYSYQYLNNSSLKTIIFFDKLKTNNIKLGGFFNPFRDPLYNIWFLTSLRASKISLSLMPIDDKMKDIFRSFLNLLNGNNPISKIIEYSLSNDCLIRLFTIGSNICINLMVLLSDSLVPIGAGIESISTALDGTGVGAAVGIFGNIIGLLAEFIPTLTNMLKQFFYFCNYMISILEFNKSLEKLGSMAGGGKNINKKKYKNTKISLRTNKKVLKYKSLKRRNIIKQSGSGKPERILGVDNLLNHFFEYTDSIPCFKINKDFESQLKSLDYTFKRPISNDEEYIQIRNAIDSMFKYIEPVLQRFVNDPQNNNDLDNLCQISDNLIKSLVSTIGKIVTLVTQGADNNIVGQSLELFISKSRPDKIYLIVKQLFKIIPDSVVKILIDPSGMESIIDNFIELLIQIINDFPDQMIETLQKNFSCLQQELQNILEVYIYPFLGMINIFKDILIKNIQNRLKPFLTSSILTLFLITPALIIFSYLNCNCITRLGDSFKKIEDNEDSKDSYNPFIKTKEQKKKQSFKISISNYTIPIFMALARETSLKFKNV